MNMDRIRELCKANSLNIAELERRAGIGNGVIARWEKQNPRIDTLKAVADVFGVTVDDLLNDGGTSRQ